MPGEEGGAGIFLAAANVCVRLASLAFARLLAMACFVDAVLRDALPFFFSLVVDRMAGLLPAVFPEPAPLVGVAGGSVFFGSIMG